MSLARCQVSAQHLGILQVVGNGVQQALYSGDKAAQTASADFQIQLRHSYLQSQPLSSSPCIQVMSPCLRTADQNQALL